jgi:hypothetical protein
MDRSLPALRLAAEALFPVRGAWAYDSWAAINTRFFADRLEPGSILWGLTAGCDFGSYNPNNNSITLHEALPGRDFAKQAKAQGEHDWVMANRDQVLISWGLKPEFFGIGTALGTLLHEAMHQFHHQQRLFDFPKADPHHNQIWLAECERISEMIGLPRRLWPLYVKRKEHADEVRSRLGDAALVFTGEQINNRRRWVWVPTLDGFEIEVDKDGSWGGQLVASAGEITAFPGCSYRRHEIKPAEQVKLILP